MQRNEKCFCGSGLKYKNCHYNIKEDSIGGEILKLYYDIDKKIKSDIKDRNITRICKEGCTECCSDYFTITEGEFAIIIDYLIKEKGKEYIDKVISNGLDQNQQFKEKYPSYYEQLEKNTTGNSRNQSIRTMLENIPEKQGFKCIFLNDAGSCSIYKVRPIICREHGLCRIGSEQDHRVCSKILSSENNKDNMTNIEEFRERIYGIQDIRSNKHNIIISRRPYPIFYSIKIYFENGQNIDTYLNHPTRKMLFDYSKEDFVNWLIKCYGIK